MHCAHRRLCHRPARPRGRHLLPLVGAALGALWACADDPATSATDPQTSSEASENGSFETANGPDDGTAAASLDGLDGDAASDEVEIAYVYSPIGKRDPFRSLFDQFQQGPETEQLTELQKFELDQLKLVGIVSRIATPYALVEDPNGKGHTLTRGKLIGKNWGRVSGINPDCVVIKEEYRDYTGRKVTNTTDMCIPKPADLDVE